MNGELFHTINVRGRLIDLSVPQVMGILNVTPDSFYAESRKQTADAIAARAKEIISEGGTMIDIGAYSTRPGASEVSEEEELRRLSFALPIVRKAVPDAVLSVDTFRPSVASRCVTEWGVDIINDVSGGCPEMFDVIARLQVPYILMSVRATMHDMLLSFAADVQAMRDRGVRDIILDPGFGFGKTLEQNYAVLATLERLGALELPVLVGVSRKSMLYKLLGCAPEQALNATTAVHAISLHKGAHILRVHDVRAAVETVAIDTAVRSQLPTLNVISHAI